MKKTKEVKTDVLKYKVVDGISYSRQAVIWPGEKDTRPMPENTTDRPIKDVRNGYERKDGSKYQISSRGTVTGFGTTDG